MMDKREAEAKLDIALAQMKEVVKKLGFGVSLMVLPAPYRDDGINASGFIHEYDENNDTKGILEADLNELGSFIGVFDKEFEHFDTEQEEN